MVTGKIRPVNIEDEMRSSYLDYAISVIVARGWGAGRQGGRDEMHCRHQHAPAGRSFRRGYYSRQPYRC